MDIEAFYDQDPRRRPSEELEFGQDWHDADGARYELSWVRDTGELYSMSEPNAAIVSDGLGDQRLGSLPSDTISVEVLGEIAAEDQLEAALAGWRDAMAQPNSLQWVRDRVAGGAAAGGTVGPDDEPTRVRGADS